MNKDIFLGLFFGGVFAFSLMALLSLVKLESVSVLFYYLGLALALFIDNLCRKLTKEKKK